MILASIALGIVTGILSFAAALIAGHGLLVALGVYVLGGIVGVAIMLMLGGVRSLVQTPVRARNGLVTART